MYMLTSGATLAVWPEAADASRKTLAAEAISELRELWNQRDQYSITRALRDDDLLGAGDEVGLVDLDILCFQVLERRGDLD